MRKTDAVRNRRVDRCCKTEVVPLPAERSLVRLYRSVTIRSGQAVVIGLNETTPCQPKVLIVDQRPGEDTAPEELDLTKPNAPSIAKYDNHTVDQFYYVLPA